MYDIFRCQKITIPQGFIYIGLSTVKKSVGYLELNPKQSLTLHHRPAIEKLTQVRGKCDVLVYDDQKSKLVTLNPDDTLIIKPAGTYHIHINPYNDDSLTYWDFDGDITQIIEELICRKQD